MQRLTQAPNIAIATLWADLLCEAGMTASVQRQYLGAAAGHLPPDQWTVPAEIGLALKAADDD